MINEEPVEEPTTAAVSVQQEESTILSIRANRAARTQLRLRLLFRYAPDAEADSEQPVVAPTIPKCQFTTTEVNPSMFQCAKALS